MDDYIYTDIVTVARRHQSVARIRLCYVACCAPPLPQSRYFEL